MINLNDMKLHEVRTDIGLQVSRVPGGWLYEIWDYDSEKYYNPVFVPYSEEFLA